MSYGSAKFQFTFDFSTGCRYCKTTPQVRKKILVDLLNKDELDRDSIHTHLASQTILEKDWLNQEEDQAWQHL